MKNNIIKYIIISCIVIIFLWGVGPYLAIANVMPFSSLSARLIPTLTIVLAWAILYGIKLTKKYGAHILKKIQNRNSNKKKNENIDDSIISLETSILIDQVKQRIFSKYKLLQFFQRRHQSWSLIIGEHDSGKSTLLKNKNFKIIKTTNITDERPSPFLFFYNSRDIIISSNNHYKKDNEWVALKKIWGQQTQLNPKAIYLCITPKLLDITSSDEKNSLLQNKIDDLKQIHHLFPKSPIKIIINKCDHFIGFSEYAALTRSHQNNRAYSTLFKKTKRSIKSPLIRAQAIIRYFNFINHIIKHHINSTSRNTNDAQLIQFPIQLKLGIKKLHHAINNLHFELQEKIRGFYFTSCLQEGNNINLFEKVLEKQIIPLHQIQPKRKETSLSIYSDNIFDLYKKPIKIKKPQFIDYIPTKSILLSIIILCLTLFLFEKSYKSSIDTYEKLMKSQPTISNLKIHNIDNVLTAKKELAVINKTNAAYVNLPGLNQIVQLKKSLEATETSWLRIDFKTYINNILVLKIKKSKDNPIALYDALDIYLMLTNQIKRDNIQIISWYNSIWHTEIQNTKTIKFLTTSLINSLNDNLKLQADAETIHSARSVLTALSNDDIALLKLKNYYTSSQQYTSPISQPIEGLSFESLSMPNFYSKSTYDEIKNTTQNQLENIINTHNDVIGKENDRSFSDYEKDNLVNHIIYDYQMQYRTKWQEKLSQIKLSPISNEQELQNAINLLSGKDQGLYTLLETIIENATMDDPNSDITITNSNILEVLNLIENTNTAKSTITSLNNITSMLQSLAVSNDKDKVSFDLTKENIQNKSSTLNTLTSQISKSQVPLSNWLDSIDQATWKILTNHTVSYLNTKWKANILPFYDSAIADKFPFNPKSNEDVALKDFETLLKPNGLIDSYFSTYLQSFVNMEGYYWTWNKVNGKQLPLQQTTLDMFIRASMIQQMFYTNNPTTPSFNYALVLKTLSNTATAFNFTSNNTTQAFNSTNNKITTFSWTGSPDGKTTATFTDNTGTSTPISFTGTWAWLHFITDNKLTPTDDSSQYFLNIKQGDNSATLGLVADNKVNPYLPNILTAFKCPEEL